MDLQSIKNRFGIIGNSPALNHALNTAVQVAATDLTVLIVGESGVGKEVFSQIIHSLSSRKHNPFIAVNCGAIPEGTIDSELFGHEKGAFTGAVDSRKGYFETVNGGTIFMDEIGEMPLGTQARLLRVLETGEFIRVGSSKVQKTDVRVIAATNRELLEFTQKGRFREDLYYRLSTVPIRVSSLRNRKEDILLLFRKFAVDFAERYKTSPIQLDEEARQMLINYPFPGNVRELKNIAEQISVLSPSPQVGGKEMNVFLPEKRENRMPMLSGQPTMHGDFANEREILYKLFFDMKKDVTELKKMFVEILQNPSLAGAAANFTNESILNDFNSLADQANINTVNHNPVVASNNHTGLIASQNNNGHAVLLSNDDIHLHEEVEESLNIMDKEKELIIKALKKHRGKRKDASMDLGISERTLYRKLKEYDIDE
ncbi:MAG: sigma-54-dependent Fis family transcriptional regulator [Sphingobacteriia bacterium]|nr:MAG: sigma-54-dependent Fis family transcriptional regulator [Sphingobacteriia bacterium]TAG31191.1 MAG: sigma-54-dependent Fis family transcriptional regulator [Sphingobacteriia bacterium]TAH07462.1 MAG: sigma-54-dependent Fis family transcriptional regulator [Sphingobacteriia bacterium]